MVSTITTQTATKKNLMARLRFLCSLSLHNLFRSIYAYGLKEPKQQEVAGAWRKWHNEKNRDFLASENVICSIKSGESDKRSMWHVCRKIEKHTRV